MSYLAGTGVIITSGVSTAVAAVAAVQAACDIEEFPRPHIMLCKKDQGCILSTVD